MSYNWQFYKKKRSDVRSDDVIALSSPLIAMHCGEGLMAVEIGLPSSPSHQWFGSHCTVCIWRHPHGYNSVTVPLSIVQEGFSSTGIEDSCSLPRSICLLGWLWLNVGYYGGIFIDMNMQDNLVIKGRGPKVHVKCSPRQDYCVIQFRWTVLYLIWNAVF